MSELKLKTRDVREGNATARTAARILVEKNLGFCIPTAQQRKNIVIAFVKRDQIVYGKAFDIVKLAEAVDLNNLEQVEIHLDSVQLFEIKSTNKAGIPSDFRKYFFGLTAAEVLVAQSLKDQFKFAFVNILTGDHIELDLAGVFVKARGIYPTWSISF